MARLFLWIHTFLLALILITGTAWAQGPTAARGGHRNRFERRRRSPAQQCARGTSKPNFEQVTTTNPAGAYRIVGLQAGTHELTVSAPQFSTLSARPESFSESARRFDPISSLKPGAVEQTVEVTASAMNTATETRDRRDRRRHPQRPGTSLERPPACRISRCWRRESPPDGTGAPPRTATARRARTPRALSS